MLILSNTFVDEVAKDGQEREELGHLDRRRGISGKTSACNKPNPPRYCDGYTGRILNGEELDKKG